MNGFLGLKRVAYVVLSCLLLSVPATTLARQSATDGHLPYPYEWSDETCKTDFIAEQLWGMGWSYDESTHSYSLGGKVTNWMGNLATKPIDFPVDEAVTCSFDYGTSGNAGVKLTFEAFYDDDSHETLGSVELEPSMSGYSTAFFSFVAKGPGRISISASYLGDWFDYASVTLRGICFKPSVLDVAATKILSPATDKVAATEKPISVTARFTNVSPFDAVNPTFCYNADGQEYKEVYYGTLAGGESVDYTFDGTYTVAAPGSGPLGVWVEIDGDGNAANDMTEKEMTYYEPLSFPYACDFDDATNWSVIDNNGDNTTWVFGSLTDGNGVAASPGYYSTNDDYLVVPGIHMPKGKHRVSFYYAALSATGSVSLQLLMGLQPSQQDLDEVLFDKSVSNGGWLNGYKQVDIPEDGVYYFAFRTTGSGDQIVIDNLRIDDGEDLCIHQTTYDTGSGFGLDKAKVTISYVNHGMTPQSNIKVRYVNYWVTADDQIEGQDIATETVAATVAPGDTIYYTFDTECDISTPGMSYQLVGQIMTQVGEDTRNDAALGQRISNYAMQQLPYAYAFDDDTRNGMWLFAKQDPDANSSWGIEDFYFCYEGSKDLKHTNYMGNQSDDWAYSEAIEMPAGEYELSFFHRGRTYFSGEEYNQSYEVLLGQDRAPEAMTVSLAKYDDIDISRPAYMKHVSRFSIPEAGVYYLGFHNTSLPNSGETHIDAISIKPVTAGLDLPYKSDFANDLDSWTRYNSGARNFTQWVLDGDMMTITRTEDDSWDYFEGMLVTPKLHLSSTANFVTVDVEYELTSDADTLKLNLYGHADNNPDWMQLLAQAGVGEGHLTYKMPVPESDMDFYFGLRTSTDPADQDSYYYGPFYTLKIKSVTVTPDNTGMMMLRDATGISIHAANGQIVIGSDSDIQRIEVYDAAGTLFGACFANGHHKELSYNGLPDMVVVKVVTAQGTSIKKVWVK